MARFASLIDKLRYGEFLKAAGTNNPFEQVVWHDELPNELPAPASTFLLSGPPLASMAQQQPDETLTPIGMVQNIDYTGAKQLAELSEIGSRYFRAVGGRWRHAVVLQRIMGKEMNLVGALYRWHLKQTPELIVNPIKDQGKSHEGGVYQIATVDTDLTSIPFGLYLVQLTEDGDAIGAEYWEKCMLGNVSKSINTGQAIITEAVQIVFARPVPMRNMLAAFKHEKLGLSAGNTPTKA